MDRLGRSQEGVLLDRFGKMDPFNVQLRPEAAERFRRLELFERQEVRDLFEDFRIGRMTDEDYREEAAEGGFQSSSL